MNHILKPPNPFKWTGTPSAYYLKESNIDLNIELAEMLILSMIVDKSIKQERLNMTKIYKRTKKAPEGDPLFNINGVLEQYLDIHVMSPFKLEFKIEDDYIEATIFSTKNSHFTKDGHAVHFKIGSVSDFASLFIQLTIFLQANKDVYKEYISFLSILEPLFTGMEDALIMADNTYIVNAIEWISSCVKKTTVDNKRVQLTIKDPSQFFGKSVIPESKYKGLN